MGIFTDIEDEGLLGNIDDHETCLILSDGQCRKSQGKQGFPALEWLAAMCSHIPDQGEQMVRYYGFYSNASPGASSKGKY